MFEAIGIVLDTEFTVISEDILQIAIRLLRNANAVIIHANFE